MIRRKMIVSIGFSAGIYVSSIYFFNTLFQLTTFDLEFILKVSVITIASWMPVYSIKKMMDWADPDPVTKIRKSNI